MANALEAASLVMIPSGYEDGTLGSLKPIDGSGDFTFTRGTDIGATRVAPDGYIEKGRENLFTNSDNLSGVTLDGLTRTTGQSDPFGNVNGSLFTETTATGNHRFYIFNIPASSQVYTYSVYAKANGRNRFQIMAAGAATSATFDLSNGTLLTSISDIDNTITSVGNGWYRISVTTYAAGWVGGYFIDDSGASSYTGDGTSGIYLFGAQVESSLVSTPYLPTTATTSVGGILANQPRIDFTGGGCGSLLLEPSRTNTAPSSGYLAPIWYVHSNISPTYNNAISPEGVNNATLFEATGNNPRFNYNATGTPAGYNAYSIFAKAGTSSYLKIRIYDSSTNHDAVFNLTDGSFSGLTSGVVAFGEDYGNGWFRVGISYNQTNAGTAYTQLYISDTSVGSVYLYGLQIEQGSYPTSLIPTYGTSVTRAADVCIDAGNSSTFNSEEGVLFFDGLFFESIIGNFISLSNGLTGTGSVSFRTDSTNRYKFFVGSYNYLTPFNEYDVTERHKIALVWSLTSFKVFIDGVKKHDVSISFTPSASFSRLNLSNYQGTGKIVNGKAKQVLTFNTALSDAECIELTTI